MVRGKQKKWLKGAAVLIPALLFLMSQTGYGNRYKVEKIVDGDTFRTMEMLTIRFDTFDAPELKNCGGIEAKEALQKILTGKTVRLDTAARDSNGRQVASVWSGNEWIDETMLRTGWVAFSSSSLDKKHVLQEIDRENERMKKGIYSDKCSQYENDKDPKCTIKGNISSEWERKGEKVYHMKNCAQYNSVRVELWRGEEWFCSEAGAAAAGYRKSERCP